MLSLRINNGYYILTMLRAVQLTGPSHQLYTFYSLKRGLAYIRHHADFTLNENLDIVAFSIHLTNRTSVCSAKSAVAAAAAAGGLGRGTGAT